MAYSMALNTVYNQYLTTYAPKKSDTRYDTHKRSELKGITNSMARVNKDAPLYKIDDSDESRQYVIGLKEESRLLQNTIASVMGNAASTKLDGKIAYSSDENIVTAKYIGDNNNTNLALTDSEYDEEGSVVTAEREVPSYDIEVKSLATSQVNIGRYLPKDTLGIEPGDYSFDLTVAGQGYEFQFSIKESDTNVDVQNRLSRLINNSNIHLKSSVEEDGEGNSSLRIESTQVGVHSGDNGKIFDITDANNEKGYGSVDYLGIDYVASEATNAEFVVNGIETSASSNTFILEKDYEITLNGVSPEEGITATVGVKPDTEAAIDNINNLIGGYNQFIKAVSEYKNNQEKSNSLLGEMNGIAGLYSAGMSRMGINIAEDGTMQIDKDRLGEAILADDAKESVSHLREFSDAMMRKTKQVSLNPVNYLKKTVVEYKNPGKTFLSPYVASAYAGMMFNSYC